MSVLFPDVPDALGVPPVFRAGLNILAAPLVLLNADVLSSLFLSQWGIFDMSGFPVLTGDSVLGMDFRKEYHVPDFPVEQGGFASYNKVSKPYDARVSFAVSGSLAERTDFLTTVDGLVASLNLYTVVTPEISYRYANLTHYDYTRQTRSGAQMITVDVFCQEIRIAQTSQFADTKQPDGASPQVNGTVQAGPDTAAPSAAFA